jgi:Glycosyl transferase family 11
MSSLPFVSLFLSIICILAYIELESSFPKSHLRKVSLPAQTYTPPCTDAPVAVYFTGGLGGHLFCAAFGIALSLNRSGTTRQLVFGAVPRDDLRFSQVSPAYLTFFSFLNITSNLDGIVSNWERGGRLIHRITLSNSGDFCRLVSIPPTCGSVQVALGYFQNSDYFMSISHSLRDMFKIPEEAISEFLQKYPRNTSSWAIHVRRGDYVAKSEMHNLLPLDYFETAIQRMKYNVQKTVFIFSDDIEWVKHQDVFQRIPNDVVFVHEKNTLLAFYFMVLAAEDGLICSNSTFCWWVAFFSEKGLKSRLVLFPERWDVRTTMTGVLSERDCGAGLLLPFMTTLSGF